MFRFNFNTEFVNAHGKFFDRELARSNELIERSHYIHTHREIV
jgi:hypothetical protein